jgi:hypothetical protein
VLQCYVLYISSHVLQPWDRGLFKEMKGKTAVALRVAEQNLDSLLGKLPSDAPQHERQTRFQTSFIRAAANAMESANVPHIERACWRQSGLLPLGHASAEFLRVLRGMPDQPVRRAATRRLTKSTVRLRGAGWSGTPEHLDELRQDQAFGALMKEDSIAAFYAAGGTDEDFNDPRYVDLTVDPLSDEFLAAVPDPAQAAHVDALVAELAEMAREMAAAKRNARVVRKAMARDPSLADQAAQLTIEHLDPAPVPRPAAERPAKRRRLGEAPAPTDLPAAAPAAGSEPRRPGMRSKRTAAAAVSDYSAFAKSGGRGEPTNKQ